VQTLKSTYTGLVTLCLLGLLGQEAGAQTPERGMIESPSAFVSGIGFISGWKCNSNDIELWLTGADREGVLTLDPAQNMPRSDTAGVCLGEEDNGWIIQVNWNELIGYDRVVARDNGEVFDSANFTIGHTGLPFIHGKGGTEVEVVDFPSPDTATRLQWSTATQHFEVSGTEDIAPCTGDACEGSGEGTVIREGSGEGGIICEPAFNSEERTHGRTITCEYRESLQSLPRAVDIVLDADGCLERDVRFEAHSYHHVHAGTVDGRPDRDANWYLVRRWHISYFFSRWIVNPSQVFAAPVPDDEPGYWNQHRYYAIHIDDQTSYHLRQGSDGYTQYQFYALGPVSSGGWDGRSPCFREIPPVPAP